MPLAEQILRGGTLDCQQLGVFPDWHIGCIGWLPAARNGANVRL
jgi:hypothetical protein